MVVLVDLPTIDMAPDVRADIAVERAIQLIREGWTQKALARLDDGTETIYTDEQAMSFCLVGAFRRAMIEVGICGQSREACDMTVALGTAVRETHGKGISAIEWNDLTVRTHEEVIALLEGMRNG